MPWKESLLWMNAYVFVIRLKDGESMPRCAASFQISRKTGIQDLRSAYEDADWSGSRIVPGAPTAMPTHCASKSKRLSRQPPKGEKPH